MDASLWNFAGQFATIFAAVAAAIPVVSVIRAAYKRTYGSRRELKK